MTTKVALITGAGTGIGASIALGLAERGVNVAINHLGEIDRADAERTAEQCRQTGVEALVAPADVGVDADCKALIERTLSQWGRIDYLINNAGYSKGQPLTELDAVDVEDFNRAFAVNCIGPFLLARYAAPAMREAGSAAIVNISSLAGLIGTGSSHPYCASKAAIINVTRALARSLAPHVRSNAICPGVVDTMHARKAMGDRYQDLVDVVERQSLTGKMVLPEDIAVTAVFLLMDARQINGEVVRVDGGIHLGMVGR